MCFEIQMSQEIQTALIAAASAIAGSLISQITPAVLSFFDKRHQRKVLLRQKYEEMALLYVDSLHWFLSVGAATSIEELMKLALPENQKRMQILCSVYFPKLSEPAVQYANACNSFYQSITKEFKSDLKIPASIQAEAREEHKAIAKKVTADRQAFDSAIIRYSKEYARA